MRRCVVWQILVGKKSVISFQGKKWRLQIPRNHWHLSTKVHDVTQNTLIFVRHYVFAAENVPSSVKLSLTFPFKYNNKTAWPRGSSHCSKNPVRAKYWTTFDNICNVKGNRINLFHNFRLYYLLEFRILFGKVSYFVFRPIFLVLKEAKTQFPFFKLHK
jgi:hypothetical protein